MNKDKENLHYYLECDRIALNRIVSHRKILHFFRLQNDLIWRYEIIMRKLRFCSNPIRKLWLRYRYKQLGLKLGFTIPYNVFGPGLAIVHYGTIIVSEGARIGENCRIHADVNIGANAGSSAAAQIGNNVYIGPGAKIVGKVTIGDNVVIGANAVVTKDVPSACTVGGVPAKIISENDSSKHLIRATEVYKINRMIRYGVLHMNVNKLKIQLKSKFPTLYDMHIEHKTKQEYKKRVKLCNESPEKLVRSVFNEVINPQRELDLKMPVTFHEKMNWLKLHWYDERAIACSDKYRVREYVESKGLGFLLNDLYDVYDRAEDIDLSKLPDKFILKATHDSGHNVICKDRKSFNFKLAKRQLNWWLQIDYAYMSGEWPYHTKHPRIICEKLLQDRIMGEIVDYKLFCFNGEPYVFFFASDRQHHAKADFYDLEWNKQDYRWFYEPGSKVFPKPKYLNEMIQYAKILSEGFPFVRVDFYEVEGKVYFGELTFFHGGGVGWFEPKEMDTVFGNKIILPQKSDPWCITRNR